MALESHRYDLTFLQREMLSTFVTFEPFTKRPRVLDVDDALWAYRGGHFARRLARLCDQIICGNNFLAEEFARSNPNVSILPTPVDTARLAPRARDNGQKAPVIGWLGLSSGFRFLYGIEPALRVLLRRHPEVRLRIVSDQPPRFSSLPSEQVDLVPYKRETETAEFQNVSLGIMPLDDGVKSRGKCSFKMLQYMACGVPVVVSPIGMNAEVLRLGEVGFGPTSSDEWVDCIEMLLKNPDLAIRMGQAGRAVAVKHYSVEVLAPKLAGTLLSVAHRTQPSSHTVNV
jgi:glycosyltransferase involved in cell wall biosynthesis